MPQRKEEFINNEIYHITTRRIGDEILFENIDDYYRGIFSIYEFNNANPVAIQKRRRKIQEIKRKFRNGRGRASTVFVIPDERNKLVEILTFSFMPNHIHLLIRQLQDNGISKFMRKIGAGYGGYYNKKYQRRGRLFDGRYRVIHIESDNQLKIVFVYIHTNPAAILVLNWKEKGIDEKDFQKVLKFIEDYRWSSYSDYLGKKNFPSITTREFLINELGGTKEAQRFINDWLHVKKKLRESYASTLKEISLE